MSLQILNLSGCKLLRDQALQRVSEAAPTLFKLDISGCAALHAPLLPRALKARALKMGSGSNCGGGVGRVGG